MNGAGRRLKLTLPGAWTALVFACLSFTPSLLPRPAAYQGVVTGIDAAIGYAVGVLGAWLWREVADRGPHTPPRRAWDTFLAVAAAAMIAATALGVRWQRQAHELAGTEPESRAAVVLVPLVAVPLFLVLVWLGRRVRWAYHRLASLLARFMGRRAARAIGLVLLVTTTTLLVTGVLWDAVVRSVDATLAVGDRLTPEGVARPTTTHRSGGPGSLVAWDALGREGRVFVGRGPSGADIATFTGRPALDPIRAYAGLDTAAESEDRARLAVRELERAGGFDRAALLVVTTTGTGWVEPSAAGSFEYLTGGDSAIVAMQYSHLPSWLSFLVDQQRARDAGRHLFDAVYERWAALPAEKRPRLYVFGESLGSFGAETAFSGEFDLANRVDGALFVGPPQFNPLYRSFVDDRDAGSREVEPVYRGGRTIRFSNRPHERVEPTGAAWSGTRVLYLQHPSDPITWWSPELLLKRPDWLEEPRGDDVLGATRWAPFVTFWQVSADLALAFSTEPGHGHNFTGEHVDGWTAVLRTRGWTEEKAAELRSLALSGSFDAPFTPSTPSVEDQVIDTEPNG